MSTAQNDVYNFQCTLVADADCNGVTIKLTETDEDGAKHDDNFYFADRHDVKADEPFVYKATGVTLPKNDAQDIDCHRYDGLYYTNRYGTKRHQLSI